MDPDERVSGLVAALHLLPFSAWLVELVFFAKRWCEKMDLATVLEIRIRSSKRLCSVNTIELSDRIELQYVKETCFLVIFSHHINYIQKVEVTSALWMPLHEASVHA